MLRENPTADWREPLSACGRQPPVAPRHGRRCATSNWGPSPGGSVADRGHHRDRATARPVRRRDDQGRHPSRHGRVPYTAFGDTYTLRDFPALELDGDEGTGEQPLCFVDQTNHAMRIGYYTDSYRR